MPLVKVLCDVWISILRELYIAIYLSAAIIAIGDKELICFPKLRGYTSSIESKTVHEMHISEEGVSHNFQADRAPHIKFIAFRILQMSWKNKQLG